MAFLIEERGRKIIDRGGGAEGRRWGDDSGKEKKIYFLQDFLIVII